MDRILARLWVGDLADGHDIAEARCVHPITRILNLSQYRYTTTRLLCLPIEHLPIDDEVLLPAATWTLVVRTIQQALEAGHHLLVHCRLGKSRAPSACAAYLMQCGFTPTEARHLVLTSRRLADPHPATWESVVRWHYARITQTRPTAPPWQACGDANLLARLEMLADLGPLHPPWAEAAPQVYDEAMERFVSPEEAL